jgi:hypothetical protein
MQGKKRNAHRALVEKPEGKSSPLGRPRCRWEDDVKLQLTKTMISDMDQNHLAQDKNQWQGIANMVTNSEFHKMLGNSSAAEQLSASQEGTNSVKLTINNNTFFFATIDKVFYYVSFILTTCFGPYIRPSSSE